MPKSATMHHDLKLLSRFEAAKRRGEKPWEFRSTEDRCFKVGDTVTFQIVTEVKRRPTGRTIGPVQITYVLNAKASAGTVPKNTCIFTHTSVCYRNQTH